MTSADRIVEVVVPAPPGRLPHVHPGSGIVSASPENGRRLIYFEGGLSGAVNLGHYADQVFHAAGRMLTRYPTVACGIVPANEVLPIGTLNMDDGEITLADSAAQQLLADWLGVETLPEDALRTAHVVRHQMLRDVREAAASGDPRRLAAAAWMNDRYDLGLAVGGIRS